MKDNLISRRQAVAGIGAGIATAAVIPAWGSDSGLSPNFDKAALLEDPTTKYPRPPFKPQQQPFPGLASKMDPVPDHGEKSYKGSGRLAGRKALITGGDSG
ncbi:MAG: NAD(P)-dependent oxidoreductase, partial [Pedobacter sp.]